MQYWYCCAVARARSCSSWKGIGQADIQLHSIMQLSGTVRFEVLMYPEDCAGNVQHGCCLDITPLHISILQATAPFTDAAGLDVTLEVLS